jgi:hypothetical protein
MKGMSDLDDEVSKMDRVGGGTLEQRIDGTEWISAWRYTYNFSQGVAWHVSISISEKG